MPYTFYVLFIDSCHISDILEICYTLIYFPYQALVNDIQTIQPNLNSVNEIGQKMKKEAESEFSLKLQNDLKALNAEWDNICQQVFY